MSLDRAQERGAAMVQFVIILPILMTIVVGIVDCCRLFAVQGVLNAGAEQGVSAAIKIANFQTDYEGRQKNDINYLQFQEARERIVTAATRVPLATLLSKPDTPSPTRLLNATHTDTGVLVEVDEAAPTFEAAAAVMRPAECVSFGDKTHCNRKTLKLSDNDSPPPVTPAVLMKKHPVQVSLQAEVKTLTPFLGNLVVTGSAMAYREEVPNGPFPNVEVEEVEGEEEETEAETEEDGTEEEEELGDVGDPWESGTLPAFAWTLAVNNPLGLPGSDALPTCANPEIPHLNPIPCPVGSI